MLFSGTNDNPVISACNVFLLLIEKHKIRAEI